MQLSQELKEDLLIRQRRLQEAMQLQGVEACLLATNVNVFYMSGIIYTGYYYLPATGQPIHFIKSPQSTPIDNAVYIRKPEQITEILKDRGIALPKSVLLETDSIPYNQIVRLLSILDLAQAQNASVWMRKIRSVKTNYEIAQVKQCARQHELVYSKIPEVYRKGMTDIELQVEIEKLMRLHGSVGTFRGYGDNMEIFMGSLLVGDNAQAPSPFDFALGGAGISPTVPLGANGSRIQPGQTIMVDMAGNYSPWMTDMTRVFSAGKTTELAYKAHQVSISIHEKTMEVFHPEYPCAELYNLALHIVKEEGLSDYFMGTTQQAKFIGHGLGLEINEPPVLTPRSKELLVENTVFALEPKFVLPGVGAVGVENTYLVTGKGLEKITLFEEQIIELS
ncbi:MAG: peptidase M24 [Bacteroidales bacterium 45-6]|nr:MAG: peptidase M24 [Bacteroidales bacterium 45-6]